MLLIYNIAVRDMLKKKAYKKYRINLDTKEIKELNENDIFISITQYERVPFELVSSKINS